VKGLQEASIQPGPTFDQGTSATAASTPCDAKGAVGAAAEVVGLGLSAAVEDVDESVDDEHPARSIAATARPAT
jgi:hypothetical protein